jgi:hypothetical protein
MPVICCDACATDCSKSEYDLKWSVDVWVGRTVYVYGDAGALKKDHPVLAFLAANGCRAVHYLRDAGFSEFEKVGIALLQHMVATAQMSVWLAYAQATHVGWRAQSTSYCWGVL